MWSDNEAVVDLLNVQHVVKAVLTVVTDDRLDPVTVGVYGDWGSGKSSVIQLLLQEVAKDDGLLAVYFNGWRFEGYEDAKAALASTILEEITREVERGASGKLQGVVESVRSRVTALWKRVDTIRLGRRALGFGLNAGIAAGGAAIAGAGAPLVLAALAAAAAHSLAKDVGSLDGAALSELFLKERKAGDEAEGKAQREAHESIRAFRSEFEALVDSLAIRRLIVVVDDLDRCLPPNVIDTLEAIRLFLSVKKTTFVIAADEELIRQAVAQRFPEVPVDSDAAAARTERPRAAVGARYLEKLIQVPVHVRPLSRSDLHGYLNLLFAEQHVAEGKQSIATGGFGALCERVRVAGGVDAVSFGLANAETLLGAPLSDELRADLALAEQITPVLSLCAEGNPRQTKRFLNALALRVEMAVARRVTLDRGIAAKLLVLEYFMPSVFHALAMEAAGAEAGTVVELEPLEANARADEHAVTPLAGAGTVSGVFAVVAAAAEATERFRTWVKAEPPLAGEDLRPYVYFASERFALGIGVVHKLSARGTKAFQDLQTASDAAQAAAADVVALLPAPEATTIIDELAKIARRGRGLTERASPLHALAKIAERRPDATAEVLAALVSVPIDVLPSNAPVLISGLARHEPAIPAVRMALQRMTEQSGNRGVQEAARQRLQSLDAPTPSRRPRRGGA
jgi:hypothetical protein